MGDVRLPLLRDRISAVDTYESPQGGPGKRPTIPQRDPHQWRDALTKQLDGVEQDARTRPKTARDELATREIIAIRPAPGSELAPDALDDARDDVRLIGRDPTTGVVLLDAPSARLESLRAKVEAFGDDARVKTKINESGNVTTTRASARAVAPIEAIALADLGDRAGAVFRGEQLIEDRKYWFEIECRGGYLRPLVETETSRTEVARQLHRLGGPTTFDQFVGPEQVYFFVNATRAQLEDLVSSTDCIYDVELSPPALRDLKLFEDMVTSELRSFQLEPPPHDAPSVVVLDTGVATAHPLLEKALLPSTSIVPGIDSPEDSYGHGTKMVGLALYRDLGAAIEEGRARPTHWVQSARLLVEPNAGMAADEHYEAWPVLTLGAVRAAEDADPRTRNRVFALAVTRSMQDPPLDGLVAPTLWSHAVEQIAFNTGHGRLLVVSAGNARTSQLMALAQQYPQLQLSEKIHQPAQAENALTVGAFTERTTMPPGPEYAEGRPVARNAGAISPYTSAGVVGADWPLKPDIVMEGGNLALFPGPLPITDVPSLSALTTSHRHARGQPLGLLAMTSEATARAGRLAAEIWTVEPDLRPETVRGLLVHSASWSTAMLRQFPGRNDRVAACGYGVPNEAVARECASGRATIVIEDEMPNGIVEQVPKKNPPKRAGTKLTEPKLCRKVKLYRLPLPEELLAGSDPDVELRVTLSYFAEPNKFRRRIFHGLDLKWDMQGPQETEAQFLDRINELQRPLATDGKRKRIASTKTFPWDIGPKLRSRGTVQSDRWRGKMSSLVGDKLIAICPVLGWWDQRKELRTKSLKFSLIVSVLGPGVYTVIRPRIDIHGTIEV